MSFFTTSNLVILGLLLEVFNLNQVTFSFMCIRRFFRCTWPNHHYNNIGFLRHAKNAVNDFSRCTCARRVGWRHEKSMGTDSMQCMPWKGLLWHALYVVKDLFMAFFECRKQIFYGIWKNAVIDHLRLALHTVNFTIF